jgi:hypothetical protein
MTTIKILQARANGLKRLLREQVRAPADDKRTCYELLAESGIHTKENPHFQIAVQLVDELLLLEDK